MKRRRSVSRSRRRSSSPPRHRPRHSDVPKDRHRLDNYIYSIVCLLRGYSGAVGQRLAVGEWLSIQYRIDEV